MNLRLDHLTQDLDEVAGALQSSSTAAAGRSLGVRRKTIQRRNERPEMNAVHGLPVLDKRKPALTPPLAPPSKRRRMTLAPIPPSRTNSRDDAVDERPPSATDMPTVLLDRRPSPESGRMRTIAREANDFPAAVQTPQGPLRLPSFMRPQELRQSPCTSSNKIAEVSQAPALPRQAKSPTPPWLTQYVQPNSEIVHEIDQPLPARLRPPSSAASLFDSSHKYSEHVAPLRRLVSSDQIPVSRSDPGWSAGRRTPLPFSTSSRRQTLSPTSMPFSPARPSNIYQAQLAKPMHLFDAADRGHYPAGDWNLPLSPSYSSVPFESRVYAGDGPFQSTSGRRAMLLSPPRQPLRVYAEHQLDHGSLSRRSTFDRTKSHSPHPQISFNPGFATPPRLTSAFGWHEPPHPPSPPVPYAPTSDDSFPQAELSDSIRFWRKAPQAGLPSQVRAEAPSCWLGHAYINQEPQQQQPGRARYTALLEREAAAQVAHPTVAGSEPLASSRYPRQSRSALIHSTPPITASPPQPNDASRLVHGAEYRSDGPATTSVAEEVVSSFPPPTPGVDPHLVGGFAPPHAEDSQTTDAGVSYDESQPTQDARPVVTTQDLEKPMWDLLGSAEDLRLALLSEEDAQEEVDANRPDGEGGFAIYQDSLEEDPIEEA